MQRLLDIALSVVALALLSPILLLIATVLRFTGEGYIFYSQERVGQNERIFYLLKFATMLKNSPNLGTGDITIKDDPRVLPIGKFLRKTKLNELPQLLNVIKGDMSLIGPRPLTQKHYELYSIEVRNVIKDVKPGLSGIGQIIFRDEEKITVGEDDPIKFYALYVAPYKGALEQWYCNNRSTKLYIRLIILTIRAVIFGTSQVPRFADDLPEPSTQLTRKLFFGKTGKF